MSDIAIKVEDLSKSFIIGHQKTEQYTALRDVISNGVKDFWKNTARIFKNKFTDGGEEAEEFWALRDVSFEIKEGDRVGIIGRNGAGKSTLLKILSRITEPTKGRVTINGRIASLLEVGTGFHPELTGRENIFLNGAILGMSRVEIKRKFDEIVAFAEIEKFLDTPVKRYSSGMYVRLAFAVAAHLEPEILVVDEVLAVGDAQFQKKCLGKMEDVSKNQGRTVLFVSHNIVVINQLCNKALLLSKGVSQGYGPTESIVNQYLNSDSKAHEFVKKEQEIYFTSFRCFGEGDDVIRPDAPCFFEFGIHCNFTRKKVHLAVGINDKYGNRLFTPFTKYDNSLMELKEGNNTVLCEVEKLYLRPDVYFLHLYVGDGNERFDYISEGISIEVVPVKFYSSYMPEEALGHFLVKHNWKLQ
jgi:lipopolysaccharide transport system ATP-binding protein